MANVSKSRLPIQVIFAIMLFVTSIAVVLTALLVTFKPSTSMTRIPNTTLPTQAFLENTIIPTDTPTLAWTSTIMPIDTSTSTLTPSPYPPAARRLPDLTVTGISDPICVHDHLFTGGRAYITLAIDVRNNGRAATYSFGPFSVRVNLILGQRHYGLDEWASKFNGLIDSSNLEVLNLDPRDDILLKLAIDLKGNTTFGIETIANSGSNTIPESDTTNNIFTQRFSIYCN